LIRATPTSGGGTLTIEAEAAGNTLAGNAAVASCSTCSGGAKVRFIGNSAANYAVINNVTMSTAGSRTLTITGEVNGTRTFFVSVNGGAASQVAVTGTSWSAPVTATMTVALNAGTNSIKLFNDGGYAPDLDSITVG
jgi:hypothetical protein